MKKEVYIDAIETVGELKQILSSFADECKIGIVKDDIYYAVSIRYEIETTSGIGKIILGD